MISKFLGPLWPYLTGVLLLFIGWQAFQYRGLMVDYQKQATEFAQWQLRHTERTLDREQAHRKQEQDWAKAREDDAHETAQRLEAVERRLDAARGTEQRLQLALEARARSVCLAASGPSSPPGSATDPAGSTPGDLSAYVSGRIGAAASELAAVADSNRERGLSCERHYDRVAGGLVSLHGSAASLLQGAGP